MLYAYAALLQPASNRGYHQLIEDISLIMTMQIVYMDKIVAKLGFISGGGVIHYV